jgi:hypothetical protein
MQAAAVEGLRRKINRQAARKPSPECRIVPLSLGGRLG